VAEPRWDNDARGHGWADGRRLEPGASELVEALRRPDWVAEDADAHLLPHLHRACEQGAVPFRFEGASTDLDGAYAVELAWLGRPEDVRAVRAAAYALIGEVAESASYIRQRRDDAAADVDEPSGDGALVFEVATGMLAPDTHFAPHGHVLVLRVTGAFGAAQLGSQ
jgi:hypothetical protein